jgi:mannosyl-oligosaccharide glucosidase
MQNAKDSLAPYQQSGNIPPDPSFTLQLPDLIDETGNLFAVQKFFDGPFQFDVFFESKSAKHALDCKYILIVARYLADILLADMLDEAIPALSEKLTKRFEETFPVTPGPDHDSLRTFSQAITANLIGGVGYFYGRSIVDRGFAYEWDQDDDEDEEDRKHVQGARLTDPRELLTATPSRSFFPRGFYW